MSFQDQETSRTKGRPVNLALIRFGENPESFYAFTTSEYPIVFDGITYAPHPIDIPNQTSSGGLDKQSLEVTVPLDSPLAELFRVVPPSYTVAITVRQGHVDGTEFPVIWIGRILGGSRAGSMAKLLCEPSSTSLRRPALRRNYMYSCPHALYGPQCKASLSAATASFVVESFTGNTVTLPVNWVDPARALKYRGGLVRWEGDAGDIIRSIVGLQEDRRLVLNGATNELEIGASIRVSLGCSRNFEIVGGQPVSDCAELHNNILNFGGQPFIPTENPIGTRLNIFY